MGSALLLIGAVFTYGVRRSRFEIGDFIMLILFSYITSNGFLLFAEAFANGVLNSTLLGELNPGETKGIIFFASLSGVVLICFLFGRFLKSLVRPKK